MLGGRPGFRVRRAGATGDDAWLAADLDFGACPGLLAAFPFPHRVTVALELRFRTTLLPSGPVAVPVSFGYHPYLRLPGLPRADWQLALPARKHLAVDARGLPSGARDALHAERAPLGERSFDALFVVGERPVAFGLAGGGRELVVELGAWYPYAQAFAPAGEDFVCFEPMTAPVNALARATGCGSPPPARASPPTGASRFVTP